MARGRPRTPLGAHGKTTTKPNPAGGYTSYTLLRLHNGTTVQVQGSGKSKSASIRQLETNCAARLGATDTDNLTTTSPLSKLLEEWQPRHEASESSKVTYKRCIDLHINPALGEVGLNELTTQRLQGFLESCTPGTARTARAVLGSAVSMAARWGVMNANPVQATRLPKRKRDEVRALTDEEMDACRQRLVEWCGGNGMGPARGEGLVEIMDVVRGTGMRIGEVLALRWCDVDLDAKTITVTGTVDGKGGRKNRPKTPTSRRTIVAAPIALDALRRQWDKPLREYAGDPVFPTRTGRYRTVNNVEARLREARGDMDITPHDFRKTVATRIEQEHGSLAASRHLGHSSTVVTEQAYLARPAVVPDYTSAL